MISGANTDNRKDIEKLKDFQFNEMVSSISPVEWIEKTEYRKFPIFNQDGSGSCVAQSMAKLLGILYWLKNKVYIHFSATDIYQRRANKPAGGMNGVDAFDIAREGITLEELVPSQDMSDEEMDSIDIEQYKHDVGSIFKISDYVSMPIKDIDTIASTIQTTGKGVMVWFYFQHDEWTDIPNIKNLTLDLNATTTSRHSVVAVDYTLHNGKKALIIEDSWGTSFGKEGQRIITEDFFKIRNWFAAYPISFKFDEPAVIKPLYTFTKFMKYGQTNEDIVALQNILKFEKLFPSNINSTGFYGSITSKAVLAWQLKNNVAPLEELNYLQGRVSGPKTISTLNNLYSK